MPFDTPGIDQALEGAFASTAIEIGPDGDVLADATVDGETGVHAARRRTCGRTRPNGRQTICDVPAATIRRIAQRIRRPRACVGETIEIEGVTLPFRPVAV